MEPGDPPHDAPLPPFLAGAVPPTIASEAAAAPAVERPAGPDDDTDTDIHAQAEAKVDDRPPRVVSLLLPAPPRGEAALAGLPITGITKRRLGWVAAAGVAVWVLLLFVRQVGDASAAQARADQIRHENETLATRVESLVRERELVQQPAYVALAARGYGLGGSRERRFALAPGAPSLPPDAPGSATLRVGHTEVTRTPLESWLETLFGPTDD